MSELRWVTVSELENWWNKKPKEFVPSFKRVLDIIKEIYETQNQKTTS